MANITLQHTTMEHAHDLFPIFSNTQNIQFTNFKTFEDLPTFSVFLQRFLGIEKESPLQYGPFCICLNNTIVGLCGLQQTHFSKGISELWYVLHVDYWGKGLAKKAVQLLLATTTQNKQLVTIYAEAVSSNTASWRILGSLGFIKTGEAVDGFIKEALKADISFYAKQLHG